VLIPSASVTSVKIAFKISEKYKKEEKWKEKCRYLNKRKFDILV